MRRSLLALSLLSSLVLAACGEEEGKTPDDGRGDSDAEGDTNHVNDDGDIIYDEFDIWSDAVLTASPATLPGAEGGPVRYTLRAGAQTAEGEPALLSEALADAAFAVTTDAGEELAVAIEQIDEDTLAVTIDVPEALGSGRGREGLNVWVNDEFLAEVPLARHVAADVGVAEFMGDSFSVLPTGFGDVICDWTLSDADADGVAEVLTVGIDADGMVVQHACKPGGEADPGSWTCQDASLDSGVKAGEDLLCGQTSHFLTKDGGVGGVMTAQTTEGRALHVQLAEYDGSGFPTSGTVTENATLAIFAVVLGMNTTKDDPEVPIAGMLAIRGGATTGRWGGVYMEGREPGEWSRLGGVTPSAVGEGKAWAGMFGTHDLSATEPTEPTGWVWSIDPSRVADGGKLVVGASLYDRSSRAFINVRQVEIDPPAFDIEVATAAGEDLDGDGHPELVVEAWGEGAHAAWVVPGMTDKANTSPITELASGIGASGQIAASVRVNGDGALVIGQPSFRVDGDGKLLSELEELVAEKGLSFGMDVTSSSLDDSLRIVQVWDGAEVLAEDVSVALPAEMGVVGTGASGGDASTCADSVTPSTSGHGVCLRGKCFCLPGSSGGHRVVVGGGSGTSAEGAPLAPGDIGLLGPDGDNLVLTRPDTSAGLPLIAITDDLGGVSLVEAVFTEDGPMVRHEGQDIFSWDGRGAVATGRTEDDRRAWFLFEPAVERSGGTSADDPEVTTVSATLRVRYADQTSGALKLPEDATEGGTTTPVLLDRTISDDGGALIGWRDGTGQAWLGVLDVAESAATTEGRPRWQSITSTKPMVETAGRVSGGSGNSGMVGLKKGIIADTPFLSMEDLETRFEDWDSPMEVPFTGEADGFGPVVMAVGSDDGYETVYIPAFTDAGDIAPVTLYSAADIDDLPIPRIAASLIPDAPQVVVSTNALGGVSLDLVDAVQPLAQQLHAFDLGGDGPVRGVSAGDLNGDGLADLLAGQGSSTVAVLSDGMGGELDGGGLDPAYFSNFAVLLGGAGGTDECKMDAESGLSQTTGRPLFGGGWLGGD